MTDNSSIPLSLTDIWQAWAAFRKGKKPSREILVFEAELELNLLRLCADLNSGNYQHGFYSHRIVNEKKRRDIAVASVRDRVVHRILYDYLVPLVDPRLDYDVYSCRPERGLHRALRRTKKLINTYSHEWLWRADISKFFDNVDHQVLKKCLERFVDDPAALHIFYIIIESYSMIIGQSVGIPIGNLTSQIFANIYLNEFDRFVRHTIKPLGYLRYGDDFVLFMDLGQIREAQDLATRWLSSNLKLQVHTKNNIVANAKQGLIFLGHKVHPLAPLSVDNHMLHKILTNINSQNAASYRTMHVPARKLKTLPWLLNSKITGREQV